MKTTSLAAFASQLRAWRQQMGWTQVEAADKLGYSASLVSGIETMDKTPTADFAQRCDTAFRTPGTFATMRDLVAREVWPSYFAPVIDLEATVIRIHEWEMRVVPGLLQTEDYARAVISAGKPRDTSAPGGRSSRLGLGTRPVRSGLNHVTPDFDQASAHSGWRY
jgi:transcriptional regulator with XRE-family HTH domain